MFHVSYTCQYASHLVPPWSTRDKGGQQDTARIARISNATVFTQYP